MDNVDVDVAVVDEVVTETPAVETQAEAQVETPEVETAEVEAPAKPRNTVVDFARTWNQVCRDKRAGLVIGSGADEVASRLGLSASYVPQRASSLRAMGIGLEAMPRGGSRLDVDAINAALLADSEPASPAVSETPEVSETPSEGEVNEG